MNDTRQLIITLLLALLMITLPAMAENAMDHDMNEGMEMGKTMQDDMGKTMHEGMDMEKHHMQGNMGEAMHEGMNMGKHGHGNMDMSGKQIRETTIDGYKVAYHLIDMHAQMPDNAEMAGTYHMMLFLKDSAGNPVTSATVGYLVKGPDGKDQKTMAMTMGKGFGANVNLLEKGEYVITAKALIGNKKIIDKFIYTPVQ